MIRVANADRVLIVTTLLLLASGVVMIYSTSFIVAMQRFGDQYFFVKKHLAFASIGLIFFVAATRINHDIYRRLAYPILACAVVLLCLLFVPGIGHKVGGATRWLKLGPLSFQPSEGAKLAVIVFLAYSLSSKGDRIKSFSVGYLPNILIPGVVIALVMAEPDFGTAVTLAVIVLVMNFLAGVRPSHLLATLVAVIPALYLVVMSFPYMTRRIRIFLDPWKDPDGAGFQTIQSYIAFGSGGVWGTGLGEGKQKLFYLPEAHTDFIFSVIGEELGLVGVTAVIALYMVILGCGVKVALGARTLFGTYLALGLTFMISLQAAINMAVVMGILPPKGLPLPFISYGGTSLVVSMVAVGIILNVYIKSNEG